MLLRETDKTENTAIDEFRIEKDFFAFAGFGRQRQNDIKIVLGNRIGIDVDIDADAGSLVARPQRQRSARAFEGKVLHILCQYIQRLLLGRSLAIGHFIAVLGLFIRLLSHCLETFFCYVRLCTVSNE